MKGAPLWNASLENLENKTLKCQQSCFSLVSHKCHAIMSTSIHLMQIIWHLTSMSDTSGSQTFFFRQHWNSMGWGWGAGGNPGLAGRRWVDVWWLLTKKWAGVGSDGQGDIWIFFIYFFLFFLFIYLFFIYLFIYLFIFFWGGGTRQKCAEKGVGEGRKIGRG